MFVQVIQGKTSNPQALDTALNTWVEALGVRHSQTAWEWRMCRRRQPTRLAAGLT